MLFENCFETVQFVSTYEQMRVSTPGNGDECTEKAAGLKAAFFLCGLVLIYPYDYLYIMSDKSKHSIGISSLSFPWAVGVSRGPRLKKRLTALELLEKTRSLGLDLLQIAENLPLENLPWETVVKLKRLAGESGINLEVGTCGTNPGHLVKFLEISRFLKSPVLRTLPAAHGEHFDLAELEKNLREVLPEYEKAGITIALENQESYAADTYANLISKIDHPNLRICLNPANAIGALEGLESVADRLGPFCGSLHINDIVIMRSQGSMGFSVEGRPAGKGQIPIQGMLDKLREYGIRHTTIIGLWTPWQGNIESTVKLEEEWVEDSLGFMKRLN